MFLLVGLGNYPQEYDLTRHNIGFMCIDNFAIQHNAVFKTENKFKGDIASIFLNNEKIILLKPRTFMNLSGEAVQKVAAFYKIAPEKVFVIFDDISLNLGKFRFRANGSDGGHNGIKSIIKDLSSSNFPRLKVGIGPQPDFMKSEKFVLQKFPKEQSELLSKVVLKSVNAIDDYIQKGITEVQNIYNGMDLSAAV